MMAFVPSAQNVQPGQPQTDHLLTLGEVTPAWAKIGAAHGLTSDADVASFLIKFYEDNSSRASPACCVNCLIPLTLICAKCGAQQKQQGPLCPQQAADNGLPPAGDPVLTPQSVDQNNSASFAAPSEDVPMVKPSDGVVLLDTDLVSPEAEQVAKLAFKTEEPPTPVTNRENQVDLHPCPHCGVKFSHMNGLKRHLSLEICYSKPPILPQLRPRPEKAKRIKCAECGLEFKTQNQLKQHMLTHTDEMPYKCPQCDAAFLKSTVLALHLATHEGRHVCHHCGSEFVNAHGLSAHLKTQVCQTQGGSADAGVLQAGATSKPLQEQTQLDTDSAPIDKNTCPHCFKKLASPSHLKRHLLSHTGKRPFACQECGASFTQKARLVDHHHRKHSKVKPIKCGSCSKKFVTTLELSRHHCKPEDSEDCGEEMASSPEQPDNFTQDWAKSSGFSGEDQSGVELEAQTANCRPFKCEHCNAEFAYSTHLTSHLQKHTGQKEFKCKHCDKAFREAHYLRSHLRTHVKPKSAQCPQCGKTLASTSALNYHMLTHTEERPFTCHICPAAFKRRTLLTKHIRTHTGEKPYLCTDCGKAFAQYCNFRRHIRIHTGEKPYNCQQCGASFAHHTTYVGHIRSHSGLKPYQCRHCEKTFRQSYGLTIHMRTHTHEKPYKCSQCSAAFSHPSSLTIHTRTHTGEKPFKCPHCGRGFATASNRTAHARTHKL